MAKVSATSVTPYLLELLHGVIVLILLAGWAFDGHIHDLFLFLVASTLTAQLWTGSCPLTGLQGALSGTVGPHSFISLLGNRILALVGAQLPTAIDRWLGPISILYLATQLLIGIWLKIVITA